MNRDRTGREGEAFFQAAEMINLTDRGEPLCTDIAVDMHFVYTDTSRMHVIL